MDKLDINILVPGMPFDGSTIKRESLGGSETAGYYMGRELARRGHRVNVFTNIQAPSADEDKVQYLPLNLWEQFTRSTLFDVAIVQRAPAAFSAKIQSRLNYLWCHDLAIKDSLQEFRGVLWNVDRVFVLSKYMQDQYRKVYGFDNADPLWITRNGIDLAAFPQEPQERDRKALVYASRPERGLDVVLDRIFPALLEKDPEYTLHVAGYQNPVEHLRGFYDGLFAKMEKYGKRITWHGHLSKEALYKLYARSGCYIYPTPSPIAKDFREVSCITAMECQAAGLPIVATGIGALTETIKPGAGRLVDQWAHDNFIEAVLELTQDPEKWAAASSAGKEAALAMDWSTVAAEWESRAYEDLAEKTKNRASLASHFIRRSDIMAARKALEGEEGERADALRDDLAKNYGWVDGDLGEYYESFTQNEYGAYSEDQARAVSGERWQSVAEALRIHKPAKILDYGCAHGHFTNLIASEFKGAKVVGVDHDRNALALAKSMAVEGASFYHHSEDFGGEYDFALAMEILEHTKEPWIVAEAVEARVKPGGIVFITVPYGPWEYTTYKHKPRQHLWEFDFHDLLDMFKNKPGLQFRCMNVSQESDLAEPLGFNILWYEADHKPVGEVDLERKLRIQAPRQTVSANIIAGPDSEQTLEWCLKSLDHIIDELVVVDCGMSKAALDIAHRYNAKIVEGVDPKTHGFETPRNIGLAHCLCDWVLWIDTDERLVDAPNIQKYFRQSFLQGLAIRQHHFACDTSFSPDMPVRFFRNNGQLRFFGMIHEHPERAINEGPGDTVVIGDAHIAHVGYLTESIRRRRFVRNTPGLLMDRERYPDRLLQKIFIMRDNTLESQYILEATGGKTTPKVVELCTETIELWRKHFMGQALFSNTNPMEYYSAACAILGLGFDVNYSLSAGGEPQPAKRVRFANESDFVNEITATAKRMVENRGSEV